jgi:hypothetical protein
MSEQFVSRIRIYKVPRGYINSTGLVTDIQRKMLQMLELVTTKDQTRVPAKKLKESARRYRM